MSAEIVKCFSVVMSSPFSMSASNSIIPKTWSNWVQAI